MTPGPLHMQSPEHCLQLLRLFYTLPEVLLCSALEFHQETSTLTASKSILPGRVLLATCLLVTLPFLSSPQYMCDEFINQISNSWEGFLARLFWQNSKMSGKHVYSRVWRSSGTLAQDASFHVLHLQTITQSMA